MDMCMRDVITDAAFNTLIQFCRPNVVRNRDGSLSTTKQWQNLCAVVQPASNNDTKHLADGDKTMSMLTIWCSRQLNPTWGDQLQLGDLIRYGEREHRIVMAQDWSQYGYCKAVASEVRHG